MELFLKIVRKDPFIFRAYYFEGDLAIGTEDKIPWPLGSFKRDIGITDRTFQFRGHGWPPSSRIEVLLFEIQEKIKSLLPPEDVKNSNLSAVIPEARTDPGGENRGEGGFEFFTCILIHIYIKMVMLKGGFKGCLVWVCRKFSSSW
jgi:hypothetical protein